MSSLLLVRYCKSSSYKYSLSKGMFFGIVFLNRFVALLVGDNIAEPELLEIKVSLHSSKEV